MPANLKFTSPKDLARFGAWHRAEFGALPDWYDSVFSALCDRERAFVEGYRP